MPDGLIPGSRFSTALAALAARQPAAALPLLRDEAAAGNADPLVGLNLGLAFADLGRFEEAVPWLERACAGLPDLPEPWFRLAQIAGLRNSDPRARDLLNQALSRDPGHVPALVALALLDEAAGDDEAALLRLEAARAVAPEEPELLVHRARLNLSARQPDLASEACEAVLATQPHHVEAARLLGSALAQLHGADPALQRLAEWSDADPFSPAWALAAAAIEAERGDHAAALAQLRAAEALEPHAPDIVVALAVALYHAGIFGEAEASLRAAITADCGNIELRNLLATVLYRQSRYSEMLGLLDAAISDFGPQPPLCLNYAMGLNATGRQDEALELVERTIAQNGARLDALTTMMAVLPYHPARGDAACLLSAGRAVDAHHPRMPAAQFRCERQSRRPLRVGVLSGCLRVHPVGWLTVAGIEQLARKGFEIACYAFKAREDWMTRRFRAGATVWRDISGLSDAAAAAQIRDDAVDILLDCGGYGQGGRLAVIQQRAAPVQVKWVGAQFSSTGIQAMDWMLTDGRETPPGFERFYSERLLRLPDGYICYTPPDYAPNVAALPALANGHVTFGCFNNLAKITPMVIAAWAEILRRVPDARLRLRTHALSDTAIRAAVAARFANAGIAAERLELLGGCPHRELLDSYNGIDLALDPFPYTGGLTVCEALWMGVPTVTLAGDSFAGRHAASHLGNVGLPEAQWVAQNVEQYVELAVRWAGVPQTLASLRAGLRDQTRRSPLCDAPRFGLALGAALTAAWQDWLERV